jgi:hypothetical protein
MKVIYSESELDAAVLFVGNNSQNWRGMFDRIREETLDHIKGILIYDPSQGSVSTGTMGISIYAQFELGDWYVRIRVNPLTDICAPQVYAEFDHTTIYAGPSTFPRDWAKAFEAFNKPVKGITSSGNTAQVNDHICVACGNTKCSKTEKSCWKCGTKI